MRRLSPRLALVALAALLLIAGWVLRDEMLYETSHHISFTGPKEVGRYEFHQYTYQSPSSRSVRTRVREPGKDTSTESRLACFEEYR